MMPQLALRAVSLLHLPLHCVSFPAAAAVEYPGRQSSGQPPSDTRHMKPIEIVYSVLCVAALGALGTVVWVSMNPVPFAVATALTGTWECQASDCAGGCAPLIYAAGEASAADERDADEFFERPVLPAAAPPLRLAGYAINVSGVPFLRKYVGAPVWTWTGNASRVATAAAASTSKVSSEQQQSVPTSVFLRPTELVIYVHPLGQPSCSAHFAKDDDSDRMGRKMKYAAVIVLMVCLIHAGIGKFRPRAASTRLAERRRMHEYAQAQRQ